jgi:hypothetical protein
VKLNFPDTNVREILPLYEALTHFKIIQDYFVQGKITVSVAEPVSPEKAIEIIERTLFADGFCIIQIAPDTVEIVGSKAYVRGRGIPTMSRPDQLPRNERLVSYLFQFKYADAQMVRQIFAQYLSPLRTYTFFMPAGNTLWVTERTSVIRQLLAVAETIDVPPTPQNQKPP